MNHSEDKRTARALIGLQVLRGMWRNKLEKMAIAEGIEACADTIKNRTHIADGIEESNVGQRSAHIMRRKRLQMKMHKQ